jgi:2-succinyl-6-hydroxy-2,4-cyclohexadiene-1-carboxylate synthase
MLHSRCLGSQSSPPLFFLHGLLGSSQDFFPIMEELQSDFYCVSLDLPGHGSSPLIKPLSFATVLDALKDTIKCYTLNPAGLVGYSMGGRLALLLEATYPHLIHQLAILSAHPGAFPQELPKLKQQEQKWIALLKKNFSSFLSQWYTQPLFHTLDQEKILKKRLANDHSALAEIMEALTLSKQHPLWAHLSETNTPILWLYGEYDRKYESLYRLLPAHFAQLSIPKASHAIHIENPLKCSYYISNFFFNL